MHIACFAYGANTLNPTFGWKRRFASPASLVICLIRSVFCLRTDNIAPNNGYRILFMTLCSKFRPQCSHQPLYQGYHNLNCCIIIIAMDNLTSEKDMRAATPITTVGTPVLCRWIHGSICGSSLYIEFAQGTSFAFAVSMTRSRSFRLKVSSAHH